MKQLWIPAAVVAALLVSSMGGLSNAHEGHQDGTTRQYTPSARFESRDQPFNSFMYSADSRSDCPSGLCGNLHSPGCLGSANTRDRYLSNLAPSETLTALAANITNSIRRELGAATGDAALMATAQNLSDRAAHLSRSASIGEPIDHVRDDLRGVVTALRQLDQRLSAYPPAPSVQEAIFGFAEALLRFGQALGQPSPTRPTERFVPAQVPRVPRAIDSQFFESGIPQVRDEHQGNLRAIPDGMEGVSLLPPAEQAAALAQRTCPVTGLPLGAHGKPLKVQLGNRTVFVCCEGCILALKSNPDKYLQRSRRAY